MNTVQVQLGQSEALPHPLKKDLAGHWVLGKAKLTLVSPVPAV